MTPDEMKLFMKSDEHLADANGLMHEARTLHKIRKFADQRICDGSDIGKLDLLVAEIVAKDKIRKAEKAIDRCINAHVKLFDLAKDANASLVNIIGGVMPIDPADAVPVIDRWMQEAADYDFPLLFETHRDSLLNDMYYTLQVMDLVPEMRLCADLSHFVVDREMRAPVTAADQAHINRILQRSDCMQGRVASREQVQVQIDFPQHQEWVAIFRHWWKQGMRAWRQRNADDATLIFLCELGPPPYAITDRNQRELSDRWQEALQIRSWAREIWSELEAED